MDNNKKISISNGGDYNLFCRFDKSLNLEKIKNDFSEHNIKVEYKMNETYESKVYS